MKPTMRARVKAYLAVRRAFGYQLRSEGTVLLNFARYAQQCAHRGPPTRGLMLRWARLSKRGSRPTWARRLQTVRRFAQYRQGMEPKTQVPPRHFFGRRAGRPTPYLYSLGQIRELLRRAHRLPGRLPPRTYATLLGLLAATGLRLSEALGLGGLDVDLSQGLLCIRASKYHKMRWVPLHPTTVRHLRPYARSRARLFPQAKYFFVAQDGRPLSGSTVEKVFARLRHGLAGPPWPRLHDLRHTFACRVLWRWQAQRRGALDRLPVLACYLGHNRVADTYWYLQAVPALLAQAGRRFQPLPP